jgi:hypothetical protein
MTGMTEKIVSFDLQISPVTQSRGSGLKSSASYKEHSILAAGSWFKLKVNARGIHKISYQDLRNIGIDPGSTDPRNIRIFGNGGGMLPEANSIPRIDDLQENSILVSGESDGQFNEGDFILFYGESPDEWYWDSKDKLYHHARNIYSDFSYYFLTTDNGPGKRVAILNSENKMPDMTITRFNDYAFYEKDDLNLIKSGRQWYDKEIFDFTSSRQYSFGFPDLDMTSPVILKTDVAGRCTSGSTSFTVMSGNQMVMSIPIASRIREKRNQDRYSHSDRQYG